MTEHRMDELIGYLLRTGVLIAAAVVAAGGAWYLASGGPAGDPRAITLIWVGLLILVATPVARVVFSLVAFALQGDRAYVVITGIVLAVLVYSLAAS
ncbi:MAG TPA: DUF1634 domain-containing protein [Bryobacteraceae bacterium]|nr:DUF1634 domain-containing protein [Bryobacteraceae bacterium]